jgi:ABC-2 type transport system permease protein
MTALVKAELLKLRTLRSTYWAAVALLATMLAIAGPALGSAGKDFHSPTALRDTVIAIGYVAVFFLAVLGATASAGEYRHGTISQRFLAAPARQRVLLAKLAAFAVVGAVTTFVLTGLGAGIGQVVVSSKGYTLGLADAGVSMMAGAALAGGMAGMLGVITGFLTRNPTNAIVAIFATWMVEKIAGLPGPFTLAEGVLGLEGPLSLGVAAGGLAAVTAALAVVAQRVVIPRDVT